METNYYPNYLRELRKARGVLQSDVAKMLGHTSSDRISHWEKGLALPGIINLFKLSIIYRVPSEDIYPDLHKSITNDLKHENGQKWPL